MAFSLESMINDGDDSGEYDFDNRDDSRVLAESGDALNIINERIATLEAKQQGLDELVERVDNAGGAYGSFSEESHNAFFEKFATFVSLYGGSTVMSTEDFAGTSLHDVDDYLKQSTESNSAATGGMWDTFLKFLSKIWQTIVRMQGGFIGLLLGDSPADDNVVIEAIPPEKLEAVVDKQIDHSQKILAAMKAAQRTAGSALIVADLTKDVVVEGIKGFFSVVSVPIKYGVYRKRCDSLAKKNERLKDVNGEMAKELKKIAKSKKNSGDLRTGKVDAATDSKLRRAAQLSMQAGATLIRVAGQQLQQTKGKVRKAKKDQKNKP